jgi:dCTP deaminase
MILTWKKIHDEVISGLITIEPYEKNQITTNSYDLRLWNTFIKYKSDVLDTSKSNSYITKTYKSWDTITLDKWDFILWASLEVVWSNKYVPMIHTKSSIARLWLFIHITADLIDIWSIWNITFQLYATLPITLTVWMLIWQVTFRSTLWDIKLYSWKYQNSSWPQASLSFKDIKDE